VVGNVFGYGLCLGSNQGQGETLALIPNMMDIQGS